jgi:hypothetical protein
LHTYTATLEPELKDRLKLDVDVGETYFVEGTLTAGLVIGAADLSPSNLAKFNKVAQDLKPASASIDPKTADKSVVRPADAAGAISSADTAETHQPAGEAVINDVRPPK